MLRMTTGRIREERGAALPLTVAVFGALFIVMSMVLVMTLMGVRAAAQSSESVNRVSKTESVRDSAASKIAKGECTTTGTLSAGNTYKVLSFDTSTMPTRAEIEAATPKCPTADSKWVAVLSSVTDRGKVSKTASLYSYVAPGSSDIPLYAIQAGMNVTLLNKLPAAMDPKGITGTVISLDNPRGSATASNNCTNTTITGDFISLHPAASDRKTNLDCEVGGVFYSNGDLTRTDIATDTCLLDSSTDGKTPAMEYCTYAFPTTGVNNAQKFNQAVCGSVHKLLNATASVTTCPTNYSYNAYQYNTEKLPSNADRVILSDAEYCLSSVLGGGDPSGRLMGYVKTITKDTVIDLTGCAESSPVQIFGHDQPAFNLPANVTFLVDSNTLFGGINLTGDKSFQIIQTMTPPAGQTLASWQQNNCYALSAFSASLRSQTPNSFAPSMNVHLYSNCSVSLTGERMPGQITADGTVYLLNAEVNAKRSLLPGEFSGTTSGGIKLVSQIDL